MNREQTSALLKDCVLRGKGNAQTIMEYWNKWANAKIKRAPVAAYEQLESINVGEQIDDWINRHKSKELKNWLKEATVDFSGLTLPSHLTGAIRINFSGFVFPSAVDFSGAWFLGDTIFRRSVFIGPAKFDNAVFQKKLSFRNAYFQNVAIFKGVQHKEYADYQRVIFEQDAIFELAHFNAETLFCGTEFCKKSRFTKSTFHSVAIFSPFNGDTCDTRSINRQDSMAIDRNKNLIHTNFCDNAEFAQSTFHDAVAFQFAIFKKDASFKSARGAICSDLRQSSFASPPDFTQASFEKPPILEGISIKQTMGENYDARYRALRLLAAQASDHHKELEYFSNELRNTQTLSPLAKTISKLYDISSKYGLSIGRPICSILALWITCAILYSFMHFHIQHENGSYIYPRYFISWLCYVIGEELNIALPNKFGLITPYEEINHPLSTSCVDNSSRDPVWSALRLSTRKLGIPFTTDISIDIEQDYSCLFGDDTPMLIHIIAFTESILNITCIFLFILSVRNYFKIERWPAG